VVAVVTSSLPGRTTVRRRLSEAEAALLTSSAGAVLGLRGRGGGVKVAVLYSPGGTAEAIFQGATAAVSKSIAEMKKVLEENSADAIQSQESPETPSRVKSPETLMLEFMRAKLRALEGRLEETARYRSALEEGSLRLEREEARLRAQLEALPPVEGHSDKARSKSTSPKTHSSSHLGTRRKDRGDGNKENEVPARTRPGVARGRELRAAPPSEPEDGAGEVLPYELDTMLRSLSLVPPPACLRAVVEEQGYVSLHLTHGVTVDISPSLAVRLRNPAQKTVFALAADGAQLAAAHPAGRLLQYGRRVEVQVEDAISVKNAKVHDKGISFTANTFALVYLVDDAGVRTTIGDIFYDMRASQPEERIFEESLQSGGSVDRQVAASEQLLGRLDYRQEGWWLCCWAMAGLKVLQAADGLVSVERCVPSGRVMVQASPSTGRLRVQSGLLQATASQGEKAHMFLRVGDRRLHYSCHTRVLAVRRAGHSAGFDSDGNFRIF
jgi:hypothetical protein